MVLPSKFESAAIRFAPHIEELHRFFSEHGLCFGSPENVPAFIESLVVPGPLRDQMASRIRSIIYREPEGMARGELLRLIAVAIGGPAVETAAQHIEEPFPPLFGFVNEALRAPLAANTPESPVVEIETGVEENVPAAPEVPVHGLTAAEEGSKSSPELKIAAGITRTLPESPVPLKNEVPSTLMVRHEPVRWPLAPPIVLVVVAVLVSLAYVARPALERMKLAPRNASGGTLEPHPTLALNRCVTIPGTPLDRSSLFERYGVANTLIDGGMFDAALIELRSLATADPALPGINLQISNALLQSKRIDQAKSAIDSQLAISDCLSKLPTEAVASYCSLEYPLSIRGNCQAQLAQTQQAAHVQAARVHLALGQAANSAWSNSAWSNSAWSEKRIEVAPGGSLDHEDSLLPATTAVTARIASPSSGSLAGRLPARKSYAAKHPAQRNQPDDKSLMEGSGTDSALGAYSKQ